MTNYMTNGKMIMINKKICSIMKNGTYIIVSLDNGEKIRYTHTTEKICNKKFKEMEQAIRDLK